MMRTKTACALAATMAIAACSEPKQLGRIEVQPGATDRAAWMANGMHGSLPVPAARAKTGRAVVRDRDGASALENEEVRFTIKGGALASTYDVATKSEVADEIRTTIAGDSGDVVFDPNSAKQESGDGVAWIEIRGTAKNDPALHVVTRFTLHAGDRALLVETAMTNRGDHEVHLARAGDVVRWPNARVFASGKSPGFRGRSSTPFLGAIGDAVSYALTSTDGQIDAETRDGAAAEDVPNIAVSETTALHDVTIAPGADVGYARVFVVGERADTTSLVSELTLASGGEVGGVAIALVDREGHAAAVPDDASLVWTLGAGEMTMIAPKHAREFRGSLPPGAYRVALVTTDDHVRVTSKPIDVTVRAGEMTHAVIPLVTP